MNLEQEITTLTERWTGWDASCRSTVADEIVENEMTRVRSESSRNGLSLVTDHSLAEYEDKFRMAYDVERVSELVALEGDTAALSGAIDRAITEGETLKSLTALQTSDANTLTAG